MSTRTFFAALVVPATAAGLLAQDNVFRATKNADEAVMLAQGAAGMIGLSGEPGNVRFITQEFSVGGRPVVNAPYSADEKTESVQTLADGNRIVNATTTKIYRDSQGRTRREVTMPGFGGDQPHTLVTINDAVKGVTYSLDPQVKAAHEMPGPASFSIAGAKMRAEFETKMAAETQARTVAGRAVTIRRAPAPDVKHEDLGENMLEGVRVQGTRETSTIEAGAMGNERPITITSERWYSPDLQIELKSIHNDPRMGQTTHTVTNIVRAEPDPGLFQVPADFETQEFKPGVVHKFEYHTTNSVEGR